MACIHLKELYRLCQEHDLRFSGSDLIRIVCRECDSEEVCPSTLTEAGETTDKFGAGEESQMANPDDPRS